MPSVMMIDADAAHLQEVHQALLQRGVSVQPFADGNEALTSLRSSRPDLIILCVELGRLSGYSICNKLKKDPLQSVVPLILTSAHASLETFEQHRRLKTHAEAYLTKPYTLEALCAEVGRFVSLTSGAAAALPFDSLVEEETRPSSELPWGTSRPSATLPPPAATPPPLAPELASLLSTDTIVSGLPTDAVVNADRLSAALEAALPADVPGPDLFGPALPAVAPVPAPFEPTQTVATFPEATNAPPADAVWALRARVAELEQAQTAKDLQHNEQLAQLSERLRDADQTQRQLSGLAQENERLKKNLLQLSDSEQQARRRLEAMQSEELAKQQADQQRQQREQQNDRATQLAQQQHISLAAELSALQKTHAQLAGQVQALAAGGQKARKAIEVASQIMDELSAAPPAAAS